MIRRLALAALLVVGCAGQQVRSGDCGEASFRASEEKVYDALAVGAIDARTAMIEIHLQEQLIATAQRQQAAGECP